MKPGIFSAAMAVAMSAFALMGQTEGAVAAPLSYGVKIQSDFLDFSTVTQNPTAPYEGYVRPVGARKAFPTTIDFKVLDDVDGYAHQVTLHYDFAFFYQPGSDGTVLDEQGGLDSNILTNEAISAGQSFDLQAGDIAPQSTYRSVFVQDRVGGSPFNVYTGTPTYFTFQLSAVPLPSSAPLLGGALLALGAATYGQRISSRRRSTT